MPAPDTPKRRPGAAAGATLLITGSFPAVMVAAIAAAIPALEAQFADVPNAAYLARLVLVIPSLFLALLAPLAGLFIDRYGRRKLFGWSVALFGAAGGLGYFLNSLEGLLISRALVGIGCAGVTTTATTLVGDYYATRERQRFLGFRGGLTNIATIGIHALGGLLASIDWRVPFLLFFLTLLLVPAVVYSIYEPERTQPTTSSPAAGPAAWPVALLAMLYSLSTVHSALFMFVIVQIPFYLPDLGYSSTRLAGVALSVSSLGIALGSMSYGRLREVVKTPAAAFAVAYAIGAVGFAGIASATGPPWIFPALLLSGAGTGLMFVNGSVWVIESVGAEIRGRVVGGLTSCLFLGQFLSPFISQPIGSAYSLAHTYAGAAAYFTLISAAFLLYIALSRGSSPSLAD